MTLSIMMSPCKYVLHSWNPVVWECGKYLQKSPGSEHFYSASTKFQLADCICIYYKFLYAVLFCNSLCGVVSINTFLALEIMFQNWAANFNISLAHWFYLFVQCFCQKYFTKIFILFKKNCKMIEEFVGKTFLFYSFSSVSRNWWTSLV